MNSKPENGPDHEGAPDIVARTYHFARRVGRLCNYLLHDLRKERDLARQLKRAASAVGAMVEEAQGGESKRDFIHKMSVAYKEARESHYWMRQLNDAGVIRPERIRDLTDEARQLKLILRAIIESAKREDPPDDPPDDDEPTVENPDDPSH